MLREQCSHPQFAVQPGDQRYPLRYGSAATEVCTLCGAFRLTGRIRKSEEWEPGPLSASVARANAVIEEEC